MPNKNYKTPFVERVRLYSYVHAEKENKDNFQFGIRMNYYGTYTIPDVIVDADMSCIILFTVQTLVPTAMDCTTLIYKQTDSQTSKFMTVSWN